MTPEERGQIAVAIEHQFRSTMKDVIDGHTTDAQEQLEIGSAVVALMLRRLYRQKGAPWLEAIIRSAMQPDDA